MDAQGMAGSLVEDVTMECVTAAGRIGQLDAAFSYDEADPFAITVLFRSRDSIIPWAFARELLERGVTEPVGEGDVHIWPSLTRDGRAVTVLELSSDDGAFLAQARTRDVLAFLARTYDLVPAGTEDTRLDLDQLVAELLT